MSKPSSVKAFLGSIEGLCLIESVLRKALKPFKDVSPTDPDQFSAFCDLTKAYLRVSSECRELLLADLKAQRDFEDLKRQIEAGMTPAEIEQTLEAHFVRKGWGSLDVVRSMLFTMFTENGASAEQANEWIELGVPRGDGRSRQLPLAHKIRKAYDRIEVAMADGALQLSEALAPSEEHGSPDDQDTTTAPTDDHSDEEKH
jgi:hypothetical protein